MATRMELRIAKLQKLFPCIDGIKDGKEFNGTETNSIHLGNAAEGGTIGGLPAADYWQEFSDKQFHPKLEDALYKMGYFVEWHDAGTVIAYPFR